MNVTEVLEIFPDLTCPKLKIQVYPIEYAWHLLKLSRKYNIKK
jgi:hypothetical protein